MLFKLFIIIMITVAFILSRNAEFKFKPLIHPVVITPIFGLLFAIEQNEMVGFTTGITIAIIVELLWGRQLVDYQRGLKYPLLVSLLTLTLYIFSGEINLFFNLFIVIVLVYSFQEVFDSFREEKYFSLLVLAFVSILVFSSTLVKELLGIVPVQFLGLLMISAGILPIVGLAKLMVDALNPEFFRDNIWYFSYTIAAIVTVVFLSANIYYGLLFFPLIWYGLYYLWKFIIKDINYKEYLRYALIILIIISTPLIVRISSPIKDNFVQYILWAESFLALFVMLNYLKLTALEGYFIITVLGIILANFGILI